MTSEGGISKVLGFEEVLRSENHLFFLYEIR